jgi:hypothetical protein
MPPANNNINNIEEEYTGPPARKKHAVDRSTEMSEGVQRLAQELAECISDPVLASAARLPLEEHSVADLQLVTCRKLREVSALCSVCTYRLIASIYSDEVKDQ